MVSKSKRGKLMLATPVYDRLKWEIQYLALDARLYAPNEDTEIKSGAGLIRWSVELFVDWYESDPTGWEPFPTEGTRGFSFYLSNMGLWDYAIKKYVARGYSDLATQALYWYFDRIDSKLESNRDQFAQLQTLPSEDLLRMFRSGQNELSLTGSAA